MTAGAYKVADATVSAAGAVAVTVSDANDIHCTRALYVGVSGNIKVTMVRGEAVTFLNVPVGIFPVQVTRVWSAGTTATDMFALY